MESTAEITEGVFVGPFRGHSASVKFKEAMPRRVRVAWIAVSSG
jgi:hypothetical protein